MRLHLFVTISVLLGASTAWAMPTPCTAQELMDQSDLVVDAEGVTVVCEGAPVDEADKTITTYRSTLFPSKSYKGGLPNSFQIVGFSYTWKGRQPTGFWVQPPVAKGWVGKLHLKQVTGGTYAYTCWNGSEEDATQSQPEPLPQCAAGDGGAGDGFVGDAAPADSVNPDVTQPPLDGAGPGGDASRPPSAGDGCSCALDAASRGAPLSLALLLGLLVALLRGSRGPRS
jgi:hypothetical protein